MTSSTRGSEEPLLLIMARAARLVAARLEPEVKRFGVTLSELRILLLVEEHRSIRPSDLAWRLGVRQAAMTPMLDRLEERMLLLRTEDAQDRRVRHVVLGTNRDWQRALAVISDIDRGITTSLRPSDVATAREVLMRLSNRLVEDALPDSLE